MEEICIRKEFSIDIPLAAGILQYTQGHFVEGFGIASQVSID